MKDPWFKFYPTDWRSDPALRMCSLGARGLWMEMICLMHEATPYGHLLINGHCPTDAQVAALTGTSPDEFLQYKHELDEAGVFSRTRNGVIYSRKMTRWMKKAAASRNNGRKGGNPNLSKERGKSGWDNPRDNPEVKPQKPESRVQKVGDGGDAGAREADPPTKPPTPPPRATYRERLLMACGADPESGLTGRGGAQLGTQAHMIEAQRWLDDLGLTRDQVIEHIETLMKRKRDGPPASLSYFTKAMERLAAEINEAQSKPMAPQHLTPVPSGGTPPRTNGGRDDGQRRQADRSDAVRAAAVGTTGGSDWG